MKCSSLDQDGSFPRGFSTNRSTFLVPPRAFLFNRPRLIKRTNGRVIRRLMTPPPPKHNNRKDVSKLIEIEKLRYQPSKKLKERESEREREREGKTEDWRGEIGKTTGRRGENARWKRTRRFRTSSTRLHEPVIKTTLTETLPLKKEHNHYMPFHLWSSWTFNSLIIKITV